MSVTNGLNRPEIINLSTTDTLITRLSNAVGIYQGVQPVLPTTYQQVQYIKIPQYSYPFIDLGIVPTADSTLTITGRCYTDSSFECIFGVFSDNGDEAFAVHSMVGASDTICLAFGSNLSYPGTAYQLDEKPPFDYEVRVTPYDVTMNITYINSGNTQTIMYNIGNPLTTLNKSIVLFGNNPPWGAPIYGNGEAYVSSFIFDDTLTNTHLNLIPCYRKADNEPGMYDIVNDNFYINTNDDPMSFLPFEVGPDV